MLFCVLHLDAHQGANHEEDDYQIDSGGSRIADRFRVNLSKSRWRGIAASVQAGQSPVSRKLRAKTL
jgi:hypothetical protein